MGKSFDKEQSVMEAGKKKGYRVIFDVMYWLFLAFSIRHIPFLIIAFLILIVLKLNDFIIGQTYCQDGLILYRVLVKNKVMYWNELTQIDLAKMEPHRKRMRLNHGVLEEIQTYYYQVYFKVGNNSAIFPLSPGYTLEEAMSPLIKILSEHSYLMERLITTNLNELEQKQVEELMDHIRYHAD